ncbi:pentatricopeptide repeat-containing protein At1g05750, chloroplastic-like [Nicotiana tabacum]|uniref:Pentatricopeptide repeat-containing protein At1g05750, chloroplastic-like n=1 Tax=Nicotiana tabacum TaxID=4097 RepID=A0A1S4CH78_TOBAC|nr:pentatricopeptide repeat-containing protein At1g05750, chloroplastic [Nicotiana tomentosiformis]XP_016500508.1 PREDICTED: pentatricopeptide repeat-containing protein At1g05750, chloroplastic-like [Nicotiana tabacum]
MALPAYTVSAATSLPSTSPHPPLTHFAHKNATTTDRSRSKFQLALKNPSNNLDSTASWTSLIANHCRNGRLIEAVSEFTRMRIYGFEPNHVTFVTMLSGCAHFPAQALSIGSALHAYAKKLGLDTQNVKVGTAIIDMYSKFGLLELARLSFDHVGIKNKVTWNTMVDGYMRNGDFRNAVKVFDEIPERDVISWTALIGGFVKNELFEEALVWFQEMQLSGVEPDYVTMISVLSACANLGTLGISLWLHRFILRREFKNNVRVNNTLIDLYCRCGCVELACQVFDKMFERSLVSWNSIIVGLAVNGHAADALLYFNLMQKERFKPDAVTFTGVLTACSHAGMVEEGLKYFKAMKGVHRISPRIEHYGCIVDLYSRAGRLEDALGVIKNMTVKPNEVVLGSILAACRNLKDVRLAERLMHYIYELDPGGDSNHVLLSNIYAAVGSWHGASTVRKKMKDLGIQKRPGISSIEIDGVVNEFVAGNRSHIRSQQIYAMLELLSGELRVSGYVEDNVNESYGCG